MTLPTASFRSLFAGVAALLLFNSAADAAEVHVMISGGLSPAYNALVPEFEKATGNKVVTAYGPSMGTTVNAIPMRLDRGEPADVLILVGYALDDLIKKGKAVAAAASTSSIPRSALPSRQARRSPTFRRRMPSSARCSRQNPSPIPTAPAASTSRPRCSRISASPMR